MRRAVLSVLLVIGIFTTVILVCGSRANGRRAAALRKQILDARQGLANMPSRSIWDQHRNEHVPLYVQQRADEVANEGLAQAVNFRIAKLEAEAAAYESNFLPPPDDVDETVDALYWTIGLFAVGSVLILMRLFVRDRQAGRRHSVAR